MTVCKIDGVAEFQITNSTNGDRQPTMKIVHADLEIHINMELIARLDDQFIQLIEEHYEIGDQCPDEPTARHARRRRNTVYAYSQGTFGKEDQLWTAIAADGTVLGSHVSSTRSWGQRDVGPEGFLHHQYKKKFGPNPEHAVDYVVLPAGESPIGDKIDPSDIRIIGGDDDA